MKYIFICFLSICFANPGQAQDYSFFIIGQEKMSIKKQALQNVSTLVDLNPGYPSSWIKKENYISTEIFMTQNDNSLSALGKYEELNDLQKDLLEATEISTDIHVKVKYRNQNAATENTDLSTINFHVTVMPDVPAEFVGGENALQDYLDTSIPSIESVIGEETDRDWMRMNLPTVNFKIDSNGKPIDILLINPGDNIELNKIMMSAIKNMPTWIPAKNSQGINVKQGFKLLLTNENGC